MATIDQKKSFINASEIPWETVGEGLRRRILGYDENLMMTYMDFKKGAVGSLHSHKHRQVTFVEQGSFEVHIGGVKKTLARGDCFFVPPDIEHGVVALEDSRLVDVFTPMREDFLVRKP